MFRNVAMIGCGMTKFGRRDDETLVNLMIESSLRAIQDANIEQSDIDALYVANMLAEELNDQTLIATALADQLVCALRLLIELRMEPLQGHLQLEMLAWLLRMGHMT